MTSPARDEPDERARKSKAAVPAAPPRDPAPATLGLAAVLLLFMAIEWIVGTDHATLLRLGADEHGSVWEGGEYWRLMTSSFLHGGFVHFFLNTTALLSLGAIFEKLYGGARLLVVYFVSVAVASLISSWVAGRMSIAALLVDTSSGIAIGASGGLFGIWLFLVVARFTHAPEVRALLASRESLKSLLWSGAINLGIGCCPVIDNAAHFGGAFAGIALGLVLRRTGPVSTPMKVAAGGLIGVALVSIGCMAVRGKTAADVYTSLERLERAGNQRDATVCASELDRLTDLAGPRLARAVGRSRRRADMIVDTAVIATRAQAALGAAQTLEEHGVRFGILLEVRARLLGGDEPAALEAAERWKVGATRPELRSLAQAFEESGRSARAVALFSQVLESDPGDYESAYMLAWELLTCKDEKARDPKRALELARKAVALRKPVWSQMDAENAETLAEAEFQNGLVDQAVEDARTALKIGSTALSDRWWKWSEAEYRARLARYETAQKDKQGR